MRVQLCGFPIDNVSMDEAVRRILGLASRSEPRHVSFVNAHYVNVAARDPDYAAALKGASLLFADGSGMRWAGRMRGVRLVDNVNGTDLFPLLATALEAAGRSVYLLGGRPGVAEGVVEYLGGHAPSLPVRGWTHGYRSREEWGEVVEEIRAARPDVLLVALGAPEQELWIRAHLERLQVPVTMAVGGLFDFYSGRIPRAPKSIRALGLEWLFRLAQEPGRLWRRYLLGNLIFLGGALKDAMRAAPLEYPS
jgi:N-acetylglucosaminyldiphosphoundecaprenol N-acetyl-beta-D-mannosaminyltransferase